jgi:hypothetical protein
MILFGTYAFSLVCPESVVDYLQQVSSTSVENLTHHPFTSLFFRALWVADASWFFYVVIFALVLAPVERKLGSWWTFRIFFIGHVWATLATQLSVSIMVDLSWLPTASDRIEDIGVSYGLYAVVGVIALLLNGKTRTKYLAVNYVVIIAMMAVDFDVASVVTAAGHASAVLFGMFAARPMLKVKGLIGKWHPRKALTDFATIA